MRSQTNFVLMLMVLTFTLTYAQEYPPKHRGVYPRLLDNGNVVDMNGKRLGSISTDGKVYETTGKMIGIIAATGEVSYGKGKGVIGVIQKNSLQTKGGYVITTDGDGVVMVSGEFVAFVDKGYPSQAYGCALYCFFSVGNKEAKEIDDSLTQ